MRLKQTLLTTAVVSFMAASPAKAEELQIGCYPKAELLAKLQANQQSQIDKMVLQSESDAKKATLTAEHNGKGYVHGGRGYLIKSLDNEACIIARMRIDTGSEKDRLTLSALHLWGQQELTSREWKQVARHAEENPDKVRQDFEAKGFSKADIDKALKVLSILAKNGGLPDQVDAEFHYKIKVTGEPMLLSQKILEPKE